VLLAGGNSPSGALGSAILYDPAIDSWTVLPSMTTARFGHTATWVPRNVVVIIGASLNQFL